MNTTREKVKVLEDLDSVREDRIYKDVRDTENRIQEILNRNLNVYVSTKGIIVTDLLNTYIFKNITEASEVYPNISSLIYAQETI